MNQTLNTYLESLQFHSISESRIKILDSIADSLLSLQVNNKKTTLLFVCTHNSRRSQFSQLWAEYFARHFQLTHLDIQSCGTEVTACNFRVIYTLRNLGFQITNPGGSNPQLSVKYSDLARPITLYSKSIESCIASSESGQIIAMMTCDHADQNCPIIPKVKSRIQLLYVDPKVTDDTPQESERYQERCRQIGEEIHYLFSKLQHFKSPN